VAFGLAVARAVFAFALAFGLGLLLRAAGFVARFFAGRGAAGLDSSRGTAGVVSGGVSLAAVGTYSLELIRSMALLPG
jgi:hypothetical protein